jgi:hypothetical protein
MRPEDITGQEVRGFDEGEVLQCVHNVNQMLRAVEFQQVYTPFELARLKKFIVDSTKPLYPNCQKYSRLSGDLNFYSLRQIMVGATKVSNIYWMCLKTCYLKETK